MGNRKKIPRLYSVRYTTEFLVTALNPGMAYEIADSELTGMVEGDDYELDKIFDIVVEEKTIHIPDDVPSNVIHSDERAEGDGGEEDDPCCDGADDDCCNGTDDEEDNEDDDEEEEE